MHTFYFTRKLRVPYARLISLKIRALGILWWCCTLPNSLLYFLLQWLTAFLPVCDLPFFLRILRDGRGLCPEGSATLRRHGCRSIKSTTMSGYNDELHPKYSGGFHGDVTTIFAGFYHVIYVWLVKITSPRNLRVIYGVNRNLVRRLKIIQFN